ncbi:hypothetical protein [Pseudonocardia sp. DLS-67]
MGAPPADAVRELHTPVVQDRPTGDPVRVPAAWAPADACTLPTAERPLREAEFAALFATSLRGMARPAPTWLRLSLDAGPGVEARTGDLTVRESSCCSFFDFRLTAADGTLTLDVRVPEARIAVLDGIARQADAARVAVGTGSRAAVSSRSPTSAPPRS